MSLTVTRVSDRRYLQTPILSDDAFGPADGTRPHLLMVGWQGPPFNGRVHVVSSLMQGPFANKFSFTVYDTRMRNRNGGSRPDAEFLRGAVGQVNRIGKAVRNCHPTAAVFFTGPGPTFWRDLLVLRELRKTGVPIVVRLFGGVLTDQLLSMSAPLRRLALGEMRHGKSFLVETKAMVADLARLCPGIPAYRVPNFIDLEALPRPKGDDRPVGEPFRVMYLGNMTATKGVETILNSVDRVCDAVGARRAVEFHFIGGEIDEGYLSEFRRRAAGIRHAGAVTVHGKMARSDAHALSVSGDVFAFPTKWPGEGQPAALIEAMGMGLVPVATRWRGVSEIVEHGVNGVLLDSPDDPHGLADAIVALASDPLTRRRLAEGARELIAAEYEAGPALVQFSKIIDQAHFAPADRILGRELGRALGAHSSGVIR